MINLNHIVSNSGDSILKQYVYSKGVLKVDLLLTEPEAETEIKISIKTNQLSFDQSYLERKEELFKTCRIEIEELSSILSVENGFYIPKNSFPELMRESRHNYCLAYGKKIAEARYMFSLSGYGRLIILSNE
jgi:hypothetical protein